MDFVHFHLSIILSITHLFLQAPLIITLPMSVYWAQNICEPGLHHSKGGARGLMRYHFLSLPVPWLDGWPPTCVFVMVNESRRYLATSILERYTVPEGTLICMIFREIFLHTVNFLSSWV
jgi:hypothetical protein